LFLCIAGYNLASSYQRQTHFQTWFVKKLKYGLILIATSFFVAIITYSSHTNFFATGILQTIALSIFMGIGLLKISISDKWRPLSYFLLGLLVFLGSEFVLQHDWLLPIISAYSFP